MAQRCKIIVNKRGTVTQSSFEVKNVSILRFGLKMRWIQFTKRADSVTI